MPDRWDEEARKLLGRAEMLRVLFAACMRDAYREGARAALEIAVTDDVKRGDILYTMFESEESDDA